MNPSPHPGVTRDADRIPWIRIIVAVPLLLVPMLPSMRDLLNEWSVGWLRTLLFAWSLATLLTPVAIVLSRRFGWLDVPAGRKAHARSTPLLGGFAIIAAFGLSLLINYHYSIGMKGVGLAGALIWAVGVLDDRWELPASLKLLAQLGAAGLLIAFGVRVTFLPDTLWGDLLEVAITTLWVVGITNAVNFLDGMDGLAAGMSAIIGLFLAVVAVQTGQSYFAFVAMSLAGACLGFLAYNFRGRRPARIFLGDNGSTFLGFVLAATVIMGDWAQDDVAKLSVPLLLLGVPIFDMTLTTINRFATGKVRTLGEWLAYTGRDHLHHRLAGLGIGRTAAVIVIWGLTAFLGISAVVLKAASGIYALLLLLQAAILFGFITYFMIYVRSHQIKLFIWQMAQGEDRGAPDPEILDEALNRGDRPGGQRRMP